MTLLYQHYSRVPRCQTRLRPILSESRQRDPESIQTLKSSAMRSLPSGQRLHTYGKRQFFMENSRSLSMVTFNGYLRLPEGIHVFPLKSPSIGRPAPNRPLNFAGHQRSGGHVAGWRPPHGDHKKRWFLIEVIQLSLW